MHMQRGMYNRFEGYENLKPLLEGTEDEILAALEGRPALVHIPAASTAATPRARFISCLLHGNEPAGFQAVVELLRRGERFPFDLWVLIGNVRAATEDGLYGHRYLDDQEDFNRVWDVDQLSTEQRRSAAAILEELRSVDLEAAVDLHNNTARNPYYAIMPRRSPEAQRLAALCADVVLVWGQRMHTLMEALGTACPAVSVECGAAHLPDGAVFASGVVHRFLTAERFDGPGLDDRPPPRMVEIGNRVIVRPEVEFEFGAKLNGVADFAIVPDQDLYNFHRLPAGHVIGRVRPGADMPLLATNLAGQDVTNQLFGINSAGDVVVAADVVPMMMTTTVEQTRRDCLFYTAGPVR